MNKLIVPELLEAIDFVYDKLWLCDEDAAVAKIDKLLGSGSTEDLQSMRDLIIDTRRSLAKEVRGIDSVKLQKDTGDRIAWKGRGIDKRRATKVWVSDRLWERLKKEYPDRVDITEDIISSSLVTRLCKIRKEIEAIKLAREKEVKDGAHRSGTFESGKYVVLISLPHIAEIRVLLERDLELADFESASRQLAEALGVLQSDYSRSKSSFSVSMYSSEASIYATLVENAVQLRIDMRKPSTEFIDRIADQLVTVLGKAARTK